MCLLCARVGLLLFVFIPQVSGLDTILSTALMELWMVIIKKNECDQKLSVTGRAQAEASVPDRGTLGDSGLATS